MKRFLAAASLFVLASCGPIYGTPPPVGTPLTIVNYWEFDTSVPGYDPAIPGSGDWINPEPRRWIKTPVSGWKINKTYDDTRLWVQFFGDIQPDANNTEEDSYFTGVWIDEINCACVGLVGLPDGNSTTVINNFTPGGQKAGEHTIDLMTATRRGTKARWQLSSASELRILEIKLPPGTKPYR